MNQFMIISTLTKILKQIANTVGNTYDSNEFSKAKTAMNQQIENMGWKNKANLVAFLKFVKS